MDSFSSFWLQFTSPSAAPGSPQAMAQQWHCGCAGAQMFASHCFPMQPLCEQFGGPVLGRSLMLVGASRKFALTLNINVARIDAAPIQGPICVHEAAALQPVWSTANSPSARPAMQAQGGWKIPFPNPLLHCSNFTLHRPTFTYCCYYRIVLHGPPRPTRPSCRPPSERSQMQHATLWLPRYPCAPACPAARAGGPYHTHIVRSTPSKHEVILALTLRHDRAWPAHKGTIKLP